MYAPKCPIHDHPMHLNDFKNRWICTQRKEPDKLGCVKGYPTLPMLAKEAMMVQNACNLSGVLHGFHEAVCNLRVVLSQWEVRDHPIVHLWMSKLKSMVPCDVMQEMQAMDWCEQKMKETHDDSNTPS